MGTIVNITSSLQTQHQGKLKEIKSRLELLQLMKDNAKQKNWREQKQCTIQMNKEVANLNL